MITLEPTRQNVRAMLAVARSCRAETQRLPDDAREAYRARCDAFWRQRAWPVWHVALDPDGGYVGLGRTPDDAREDAARWVSTAPEWLDVYPASDAFLEEPEASRPAFPAVIDGKVSNVDGGRRRCTG